MRKGIKREQESITWLNEKGAKTLRSVAAFHCKAEWINENCSKVNEVAQVWEKNLLIIGSEIWYMFDFSRNIVVIIVQSGLKLYNFTILAAGVETEQVCNLFAQRSHHVRVWSKWRQNQFELEEVISMQLRSKITVARNIRIHHHSLFNAKHKMQLFSG